MKRRAALAALTVMCAVGPAAWAQQQMAVPSYFDTAAGQHADWWADIQASAPTVGLAVINPGNGLASNATFQSYNAMLGTKPAGQKVLGYVFTRYAGTQLQTGDPDRSVAGIETNIERYYTNNPNIDGIFLDEATHDCGAHESYYAAIRSYMSQNHSAALLVINPGTDVPQCYLGDADIIISFEGTFASYTNTKLNVSDDPGGGTGTFNTNRAKFWHLIHDTTGTTDMATALDWSRQNYAGWVDVAGSTWQALPDYFDAEVANVQANGGPVTVTIRALDIDNANASISGLCIFVDGASTCAWTPLTTTLPRGSHTFVMTSFQNLVFNHWDNGSTSPSRTETLTGNSTFDAYYHSR